MRLQRRETVTFAITKTVLRVVKCRVKPIPYDVNVLLLLLFYIQPDGAESKLVPSCAPEFFPRLAVN
jgi:hypothetical protein